MKRPYDCATPASPGGSTPAVPDAEVAAWAGHSVEMLRRVYAGRAQGLDSIWITRMNQTLPQDTPSPGGTPGGARRTVPEQRTETDRDQA